MTILIKLQQQTTKNSLQSFIQNSIVAEEVEVLQAFKNQGWMVISLTRNCFDKQEKLL